MKKMYIELSLIGELMFVGVPLLASLKTFKSEYWLESAKLIENGFTFSESLDKIKLPISNDDKKVLVEIVRSGELGGCLEVVLSRIDGKLNIKSNETVTFLRYFGLLLSCGVPILRAINIVPVKSDEFLTFKGKLYDSIREGCDIATPMMESNLFPEYIVKISSCGEQTGSLPDCLSKAADLYEKYECVPWYKKLF